MPSQQQKPAKKGSNQILVTLSWDEGRCPGHKNVCW